MGQEKIKSQKMLVQNSLDPNNYGSTKVWVQILCPKKSVGPGQTKFGLKIFWSKEITASKNCTPKVLSTLGQ